MFLITLIYNIYMFFTQNRRLCFVTIQNDASYIYFMHSLHKQTRKGELIFAHSHVSFLKTFNAF